MTREDLMTAQEVADILGIAVPTLYDNRHRERMGIPFFKVGKKLFVYRSQFDKWYKNAMLEAVA